MKKNGKKIIILILAIVCLILTINIINNFNLYTMRYGIKNINTNQKIVSNKYYLISSDNLYNKDKYIKAYKMGLFGINDEAVYIDLEGNEYDVKDSVVNNYIQDFVEENKYNVYVKEENEKYGLVDINENQILPYNFEDITIINENFFIVSINDEEFLWNNHNENLGKIFVTKLLENNQIRLNKVNDLNYDEIMNVDEDFIIFGNKMAIKKDNVFLIFDESGRKVTDNEYSKFNIISQEGSKEEIASVTQDGKNLLLDKDLNVIYEYDIDEVIRYNNRLLIIQNNDKKGVAKLDNTKILDTRYDDVIIYDNYILTRNGKQYYIFNYNGNLLFETDDVSLVLSDGENFIYKGYDNALVLFYSSIMFISLIIIAVSIKYILFNKDQKEK